MEQSIYVLPKPPIMGLKGLSVNGADLIMKYQIDKISVARSQLDTVVKLIFEDHDAIATATLLHAAWHVLKDLSKHKGISSSRDWMAEDQLSQPERVGVTEQDVWGILNKDWNFLKHAQGDPDAILDFEDDYLEGVAMFAINDFGQIAAQSMSMDVYKLWFIAKNPDIFKGKPGEEGLNVYEVAVRVFPGLHAKDLPQQRQIGLSVLRKPKAEFEMLLMTD